MAKRSRRIVREERAGSGQVPTAAASGRTGRRTRARHTSEPSFFDRYRTALVGGIAVVGVLIIGLFMMQGSAHAAYICDTQLTPAPAETLNPTPTALATPTPSPSPSPSPSVSASASESPSASASVAASPTAEASPTEQPSPTASPSPTPQPTPRLGFTTTVLGRTHVATGSTIEYGFCPPDSGNHYNDPPLGPIPANIYGAASEQVPGGWVHNLEHGWIVLLYRCPSGTIGQGDCISQDDYNQLQQWYNAAPTPAAIEGCSRETLVARFDSMSTNFAELAWGRAYLFDQLNLDNALTFAQQWMDHAAVPEPNLC